MTHSRAFINPQAKKQGKGTRLSGTAIVLTTILCYLSWSLSVQAITLSPALLSWLYRWGSWGPERCSAQGHRVRGRQEFHFRTLCLWAWCSFPCGTLGLAGVGWGMPWDVGDEVRMLRGQGRKGGRGPAEEGVTKELFRKFSKDLWILLIRKIDCNFT